MSKLLIDMMLSSSTCNVTMQGVWMLWLMKLGIKCLELSRLANSVSRDWQFQLRPSCDLQNEEGCRKL